MGFCEHDSEPLGFLKEGDFLTNFLCLQGRTVNYFAVSISSETPVNIYQGTSKKTVIFMVLLY
jgi:hypothetical protein